MSMDEDPRLPMRRALEEFDRARGEHQSALDSLDVAKSVFADAVKLSKDAEAEVVKLSDLRRSGSPSVFLFGEHLYEISASGVFRRKVERIG